MKNANDEKSERKSRFAQQLIVFGIFNLIFNGKNLILLPLLTRNLSITNFGLYDLFITSATFFPLLISLGLPYTMVRFLAAENQKDRMRETFFSIFSILLVISSIVGVLTVVIGLILLVTFDEAIVVVVLGLTLIPDCLILVVLDFLRAKRMVNYYSLFKTFQIILIVVFSFFAVNSGDKLMNAMLAVFVSDLITLGSVLTLILRTIGFQIPKFRYFREYFKFGLPIFISNLSYLLVSSFDRYVIAFFLGTAFVGYYSPAYTVGSIFTMFVAPFGFLLPAVLSSSYDANNYEEVRYYLKQSFRLYFLIAIPGIFGITVLSYEVLSILTTEEIVTKSFFLIPIIGLGIALWGIYVITAQILVITKRTAITGRIWILAALLNVVVTPLFVIWHGIMGAAISTLATYGFIAASSIIASYRTFNFAIDFLFFIKCLIASIIMSILILFFEPTGIVQLISLVALGGITYFIVMGILKGVTKDDVLVIQKSINPLKKD